MLARVFKGLALSSAFQSRFLDLEAPKHTLELGLVPVHHPVARQVAWMR
jgi:hypothetical protein